MYHHNAAGKMHNLSEQHKDDTSSLKMAHEAEIVKLGTSHQQKLDTLTTKLAATVKERDNNNNNNSQDY